MSLADYIAPLPRTRESRLGKEIDDADFSVRLTEGEVAALRGALARHKLLIVRDASVGEASLTRLHAAISDLGALHVPGFPELLFVDASDLEFTDLKTGETRRTPWRPNTLLLWDQTAVRVMRVNEADGQRARAH